MELEFKKVNDFAGGTYKARCGNVTIYWYPSLNKLYIGNKESGAGLDLDKLPQVRS